MGAARLTLAELNAAARPEAEQAFRRCCGSSLWARRMAEGRPYADILQLLKAAQANWNGLGREDWLEAFRAHPRIGDRDALRAKLSASWAAGEQSGARGASEETLEALASGNAGYEARFGHVFLICATGRSAEEMLGELRGRLKNPPEKELRIAAAEQAKITELRLGKLLEAAAA